MERHAGVAGENRGFYQSTVNGTMLKVKLGVDKDIKYVYFLLTLMMCTSYVELCTLHVYLSILGGIHVLELDNYCVSIHWYRINIVNIVIARCL